MRSRKSPWCLAGRVLLLSLLANFWLTGHCAAQTDDFAHQVKAAMLYKFLGYVEWPAETFPTPTSPYVIAVAGAADIASELVHITVGRTINERPIVIKKVTSRDDLRDVHLLFVGGDATPSQRARLFRRAGKRPLVTVTESDQGPVSGGIINFRVVNDRVGFDVSLTTAEARNLKLSARLLAVAASVDTGGP